MQYIGGAFHQVKLHLKYKTSLRSRLKGWSSQLALRSRGMRWDSSPVRPSKKSCGNELFYYYYAGKEIWSLCFHSFIISYSFPLGVDRTAQKSFRIGWEWEEKNILHISLLLSMCSHSFQNSDFSNLICGMDLLFKNAGRPRAWLDLVGRKNKTLPCWSEQLIALWMPVGSCIRNRAVSLWRQLHKLKDAVVSHILEDVCPIYVIFVL